ncbi:MAG: Rnase Y domain-containing protein, partial [Dehalococcoidia bacterium]|nr:Rnase Y domain-containing protein [Dehalococcoidia bacterium]
MANIIINIVLAVLAVAGLGVSAWLILRSKFDGTKVDSARERAETIVTQAEEEQRKLLLAAQEEVLRLRTEGENDVKEQRQELNRQERRFFQREEQLERKTENLEQMQDELSGKETEVQQALVEAEELKGKQLEALESVAGMNVADARQIVVKRGE